MQDKKRHLVYYLVDLVYETPQTFTQDNLINQTK